MHRGEAWQVYFLDSQNLINAKDSPWDAVLMGSVASTVDANITNLGIPLVETGTIWFKLVIRSSKRHFALLKHLCDHAFCLLLQLQNIFSYLFQTPQWLVLVKVFRKVDLVPDFSFCFVNPGIGQVG